MSCAAKPTDSLKLEKYRKPKSKWIKVWFLSKKIYIWNQVWSFSRQKQWKTDTWYRWNERKRKALFQLVRWPAYKDTGNEFKVTLDAKWRWKSEKCSQNDQLTLTVQTLTFVSTLTTSYLFCWICIYEYIYAFLGASKVQWVLSLTLSACLWKSWGLAVRVRQQLGAVWLTDWLKRWQTDRQQERGKREVTACFMCVCVIAGNLPSAVSMTLVWWL